MTVVTERPRETIISGGTTPRNEVSMLSYRTTLQRFFDHVAIVGVCWEWTSAKRGPYGVFTLRKGCQVAVHRFAYELMVGPIPSGLLVCHHCDNPVCIRIEHLFLGTPADNSRDMVLKGRAALGDRNGQRLHPQCVLRGERANGVKLSATQVASIRARYVPRRVTLEQLATEYGVSLSNVHAIVKGDTWRQV